MFTKVSEQRSAARRYVLRKAAAGPTYDTGGWAPQPVAAIPKTETPNYRPERIFDDFTYEGESAKPASTSVDYWPIQGLDRLKWQPHNMRAKADPRYANWYAAHNAALESMPTSTATYGIDFGSLPKTREALAKAYHRKMYELTNGVPVRASSVYTR